MKKTHQVHPDDERAFGTFNLGEIFNRINGFSKGMTFLSLIVGIATIIAGVIGIGNILLISVKERTKELGVRRALGATPREVRLQIIMECLELFWEHLFCLALIRPPKTLVTFPIPIPLYRFLLSSEP